MAERRERLDATQRQRLAGFLHDLPITLDHETAAQAWRVTTVLAEQFRLTVYIAAHLELAQRLILPLATLDLELRAAATALNVPWLGKDDDGSSIVDPPL
jgi:predicted nucleic acid-binding protein